MLMPLTFFIPRIFKRFDKFLWVLLFLIIISVFIETLQFLFQTGSCDIDDVILNVTGAAAVYPLFKKLSKTKTEVV